MCGCGANVNGGAGNSVKRVPAGVDGRRESPAHRQLLGCRQCLGRCLSVVLMWRMREISFCVPKEAFVVVVNACGHKRGHTRRRFADACTTALRTYPRTSCGYWMGALRLLGGCFVVSGGLARVASCADRLRRDRMTPRHIRNRRKRPKQRAGRRRPSKDKRQSKDN